MIDTICLKHKFQDIDSYDKCYEIIDDLARRKSRNHCLHKKKKRIYSTNAFASEGLLEIRFCKKRKLEDRL